jgi:hypothetical protein
VVKRRVICEEDASQKRMCLEAGDGGALIKYDVQRVNLGKEKLISASRMKSPNDSDQTISPNTQWLGCNRTKMANDPLRERATRGLTQGFNRRLV